MAPAVYALSPSAIVEVLGEAPALSRDLAREVERLWEAEQQRRGRALFNGRILSATEIGAGRIAGYADEYRRFIAQRQRPDLFAELRVRPVAVSGLLRCPDGIVFGRRAGFTTEDAGMWELAPSGGVDTSGIHGVSRADLKLQILAELREEIGLTPDKIEAIPFCVVEDPDSHVVDVGIRLEAPDLTAAAVLGAHRERGSAEYSELVVVASANVAEFIERTPPGVASASRAILGAYERLGHPRK
jgi:hypothetical protein